MMVGLSLSHCSDSLDMMKKCPVGGEGEKAENRDEGEESQVSKVCQSILFVH